MAEADMPPATIETDICVIGAGSGGLSVAAGASQMGARVVLIEKGEMGGDCLNTGCVPSKALLAAGHAARAVRTAGRFGVEATLDGIDGKAVYDHVEGVIDAIRPMDSPERFEGLGVTVIAEHGRFTGPTTVQAGPTEIRAKRVVVATGSSAEHAVAIMHEGDDRGEEQEEEDDDLLAAEEQLDRARTRREDALRSMSADVEALELQMNKLDAKLAASPGDDATIARLHALKESIKSEVTELEVVVTGT